MSSSRSWATKTRHRRPSSSNTPHRRPVAAADRVHGGDVGVRAQRLLHQRRHGLVDPVGLGDLDDPAGGPARPHLGAEAHLALLLAAERSTAEGDEHAAGLLAQPLLHEVGRSRSRRAVVDADVRRPPAGRQVRDQGDDRDASGLEPRDRVDDLRDVGRLEQDAVRAAGGDPVQDGDDVARRARSRAGRTGPGRAPAAASAARPRRRCGPLRRSARVSA